jgi:hypothetical protein
LFLKEAHKWVKDLRRHVSLLMVLCSKPPDLDAVHRRAPGSALDLEAAVEEDLPKK